MEEISLKQLKIKNFHGIGLQIFLSLAVSLTALSDGITVGWTAEQISQLTVSNSTLTEASLVGTLSYYANILILPFAVISANEIGRKWTILWGALLVFLSWVILYFAKRIEYIYLGVFWEGLGMFVIYTINEVYIAETAQANIRGFLCSCIPVLLNLGILISCFCNMFISLQSVTIIGMIAVGLVFPCFIWAPKSPHFLLLKNKPIEAKEALLKLRDSIEVDDELEDIKIVIERNSLEKSSFEDFFTDKTNRKVLFIVLGVQIIQQFSGIDTILMFIEVIFESSHSLLSNRFSMTIFALSKCIFCIVSLVLLDKVGRRPLLIFSCIVTTCSLFVLGLYFFLQEVFFYDVSKWSWTLLSIIIVYIFGYNLGLGTVTYILGSEMFPTKFKALGVSVTQIVYVVSVILVTEICARLKDYVGFYLAFWFLCFATFLGLIFVVFYVKETKGKSLKQILDDLNVSEEYVSQS